MTEVNAGYKVGDGIDLDAFKGLPCSLLHREEGYEPPTPEQVDALIKAAGWSQNDAAKIVGVTYNPKKGSSTIRRWRTAEGKPDHRPIPYTAWRLFLINAGVVSDYPDS